MRSGLSARAKPNVSVSAARDAVSVKTTTRVPTCEAEKFFHKRWASSEGRSPLSDETNGNSPAVVVSSKVDLQSVTTSPATRLKQVLERAAADVRDTDARLDVVTRENDLLRQSLAASNERVESLRRTDEASSTSSSEIVTTLEAQVTKLRNELSETQKNASSATSAINETKKNAQADEKKHADEIAQLVNRVNVLASTLEKSQGKSKALLSENTTLRSCITSHEEYTTNLRKKCEIRNQASNVMKNALGDARLELAVTNAKLDELVQDAARVASVASGRHVVEEDSNAEMDVLRWAAADAKDAASKLEASNAARDAAVEEIEALNLALKETKNINETQAVRILELEATHAKSTARITGSGEETGKVGTLRSELESVRTALAAAEEESSLAVSWARNAAKDEAEEVWAAKRVALEKALETERLGRAADRKALEAAEAKQKEAAAASEAEDKKAKSESLDGDVHTQLTLAVADSKAHAAAAASAVADVNLLRATLTEERALAHTNVTALKEAQARLRAAAATETSLIKQVRNIETRGQHALAEVAQRVAEADQRAVKNLSRWEARAEAADKTNAQLARELWLTRQKAEIDLRELELKLEEARRKASTAAKSDALRRHGCMSDDAHVRDADAVVLEMQRELEAETAASEAAAAESARREGVSRRKLAANELKLKEASAALAEAARQLDAKNKALRKTEEERKRILETAEKLERRARRAEEALQVDR